MKGDKIYIGDFVLRSSTTTSRRMRMPASRFGQRARRFMEIPASLSPQDVRIPPPPSARKPIPPVEPPSAARVDTAPSPAFGEVHARDGAPSAHLQEGLPTSPPAGSSNALQAAPTRAGESTVGRVLESQLDASGASALAALMARLAEGFDVRDSSVAAMDDAARWSEAERAIERAYRALVVHGAIDAQLDSATLLAAALREAVGLGVLEALLADDSIREIVIVGPHHVSVDRGTGFDATRGGFSDLAALYTVIERLLARGGTSFDRNGTSYETVLPNGAHVTVLLPPLRSTRPRRRDPPTREGPIARRARRARPRVDGGSRGDRAGGHERKEHLRRRPERQRRDEPVKRDVGFIPSNERIVTVEAIPISSSIGQERFR